MATSTTELILKFTGDPRSLKAAMAQIRDDLAKTSTGQTRQFSQVVTQWKAGERQRVSESTKANRDIQRLEKERASIMAQNAKAVERLAKSEATTRIREGKRAATEIIRQLQDQQRAVVQTSRQAQAGLSRSFLAGAAGGISALVGISAVNEIREAASAWVDYSSKLQSTKIAFTQMLGSAEAAQRHLEDLQQFALKTPFQFSELIDASQRMQALGFRAEQVIPVLTDVGNAVAAAGGGGERLDRVVLALSQIQSKGKVATQELNQLAESGIPAFKILQDALGKSRAELVKLIEDGQISSKVFLDAFQKFSQVNFGGLMEQQSRTFSGAMSNIKDALLQTSSVAFAPLFERLSETARHISDLSTKSDDFKRKAESIGRFMATVWDGAVEAINILRDVYHLGLTLIIQNIDRLTTFVMILVSAFKQLYFAVLLTVQVMKKDLVGAMQTWTRLQREQESMGEIIAKGIKNEGALVRELTRIYNDAAAAAKRSADERARATVGFEPGAGLSPRFQKGTGVDVSISEGLTRLKEPNQLSKVEKEKDAGIQLLQQLQKELRGLEGATRAEEIAAELLDTRFKDVNATVKEQIILLAKTIDRKKESIEADKKLTDEAEKQQRELKAAQDDLAHFMQQQIDDLRAARGETRSAADEVTRFIDQLSLQTGTASEVIDKATEAWLRFVAATIDAQNHVNAIIDQLREGLGPGPIGTVPEIKPGEPVFKDTLGEPPDLSIWEEALDRLESRLIKFREFSIQTIGVAIEGMAEALAQGAEAWILYGENLGKVLRQSLAVVAARIAGEALLQSLLHAAYAIGNLAFGNFGAAAKHAIAAAKFAGVAAIAGLAGRAIAGNSFKSAGGGGGETSAGGGGSRNTTTSTQPSRVDINRNVLQPIIVIRGEATEGFRYIVEKAVVQSYRDNGKMKDVVNHALGTPGYQV